MLNQEITDILDASASMGWIMEPDAKKLLRLAGIDTTRFIFTEDPEAAAAFAKDLGYPVVAKVVSPRIVHKSDVGGVAAGITNEGDLNRAFGRMMLLDGATGVIVEEMVKGVELIAGAKIDDQFGPIVLLGAGGTAVEIYKDVALRMAPLVEKDVGSMLASLKARPLLEGYRGAEPIDVGALTAMLLNFSALLMDLGDRIESIDLNPVICSPTRAVAADARIILR
ncbi:MAG TPA: acetate--CoA ligase family protein [Syntrophorhabdaceae bacterium]|jgi:acyl-CoA synthetase (NDP forming)